MKLDETLKSKVLKEIQHGEITTLQDLTSKNPIFHWSWIFYKKTGDTVLHCASRLGFTEVINLLLTNYTPSSVDVKNKDDKTPLHEAAQFAQHECCATLLKHGAKVNAIRRGDWTPLMLSCTKVQPEASYKTVLLLLNHGAIVNYNNKDGWTALHLISREGDREILDLLLKHGLDAKKRTKNGRTGLHIATLHGNVEIVTRLLDLGLNADETDNCGNTALHEAVLGKHIHLIKVLIERGADTCHRNKNDLTLLHLAASQEDKDVVEYVLNELKFDVNVRNRNGWTALHCAARKGLENVYDCLVEWGADKNIRDGFGRTALEYFELC